MTTSHGVIDNSGFRITRIRAKNYRSIRELDLELGPLTVLVGPNASGKSNVLDVLRFIRDAISRGLDFAISQRHGMGSIRHQRPGRGGPRDVELGFNATFRDFTLDYRFVFTSDTTGGHRVKREYGWYMLDDMPKQVRFDIKEGHVIKPKLPPDSDAGDLHTEDLSFFSSRRFLLAGITDEPEDHRRLLSSRLFGMYRELSEFGFYHVFPNTIREPQKPLNPSRLDEHGNNLGSVLREMQRSKVRTRVFRDLNSSLTHVVPGIAEVKSEPVGGYLVLKFKHVTILDNRGLWLDAAQESDGTLRMLALLTAIYQRRRPRLLGIEEPESAVHPGVLTALAEVVEEASLRQQIVITTHSPNLIDHFPIECIRAVEFSYGATWVGEVSRRQSTAVKEGLFTPGELHSMEGLEINTPVAQ